MRDGTQDLEGRDLGTGGNLRSRGNRLVGRATTGGCNQGIRTRILGRDSWVPLPSTSPSGPGTETPASEVLARLGKIKGQRQGSGRSPDGRAGLGVLCRILSCILPLT